VTVYINWPMIKALKHFGSALGGDGSGALMLGPLAMALIIPVATIVLVNRKIAPTARARFRNKPTETPV